MDKLIAYLAGHGVEAYVDDFGALIVVDVTAKAGRLFKDEIELEATFSAVRRYLGY